MLKLKVEPFPSRNFGQGRDGLVVNPDLRDVCSDLRAMHKQVIVFCFAALLAGCYETSVSPTQHRIVSEIARQAPGPISLSHIADEKRSRVCFFGPYTHKSSDVLGFDWDVTKKTGIRSDDTINVIVFATNDEVTEFVVVPRNEADFWKLSQQCFSRNDAQFIYQERVWSYLHNNA
jgi:hypothetical protein